MFLGATPIPPFDEGTAEPVEKNVAHRCVKGEITPARPLEVFSGCPRLPGPQGGKARLFSYTNCHVGGFVNPKSTAVVM
jgi:hypothetical protein